MKRLNIVVESIHSMTNILETFKEQLNDEEFINEFWTDTEEQLKGTLFNYFGNKEVYSQADCKAMFKEIEKRCQNLDSNLDINHDHNTVYDTTPQDIGLSAYERNR